MNSRLMGTVRVLLMLMPLLLSACSDSEREDDLVDLFTTANQGVTAIRFADNTESTVSINSVVEFNVLGERSNGAAPVSLNNDVEWSLSAGASSQIGQDGRFIASAVAESVTVTARLGVLNTSIDVRVSAARFDQVVQLDETGIEVDMCQSRTLRPVGRYVDDDGNEEIRSVDSSVIGTIEWLVRHAEDDSPATRAYIDAGAGQPSLYTLAAGDLNIQARAISAFSGNEVTSAVFPQAVGNGLGSIKLCLDGTADLTNCLLTSSRVEKDQDLSLISVGAYQAADGSTVYENISRNSQWGSSNTVNASSDFSADRERMIVRGNVESSSLELSVACGRIEQSLVALDISQGVNLGIPVSCAGNLDCVAAQASISVDQLSVLSFDVSANSFDLTDDTALILQTRPSEITLTVLANFSNGTQSDVTSDGALTYSLISIDGQADSVEEKAGEAGVYTVLGPGTAKIQLDFRQQSFIALIEIP